jgi:hypothetical protein
VQTARLVGTQRTHATGPTDVPRLYDPHARECDAWLLYETGDDLPQDRFHVTFTGDPQRQILQGFEVHDRLEIAPR